MEHRTSPRRPSSSTRAHGASVGLRASMIGLAIGALGAMTGCYDWTPIRSMGVPGAKLDKQLDGQQVRYDVFDQTVETEVVKARTPYLEVRSRDYRTGEKQTKTIDLNDVRYPEVKVVHRDQQIAAIVVGSTVGAAVIGTLVGLAIDGMSKSRTSFGSINMVGYGD